VELGAVELVKGAKEAPENKMQAAPENKSRKPAKAKK
jgi:hypothetical protein